MRFVDFRIRAGGRGAVFAALPAEAQTRHIRRNNWRQHNRGSGIYKGTPQRFAFELRFRPVLPPDRRRTRAQKYGIQRYVRGYLVPEFRCLVRLASSADSVGRHVRTRRGNQLRFAVGQSICSRHVRNGNSRTQKRYFVDPPSHARIGGSKARRAFPPHTNPDRSLWQNRLWIWLVVVLGRSQ